MSFELVSYLEENVAFASREAVKLLSSSSNFSFGSFAKEVDVIYDGLEHLGMNDVIANRKDWLRAQQTMLNYDITLKLVTTRRDRVYGFARHEQCAVKFIIISNLARGVSAQNIEPATFKAEGVTMTIEQLGEHMLLLPSRELFSFTSIMGALPKRKSPLISS